MATNYPARQTDVATYPALYRKVKEVLLEGRRRIEAEKVRTYWEAGRLIREHLLENEDRADYGASLFVDLARDLSVSKDLLYRCSRFNQTYPDFEKVVARPQLSWTHFKKLITVSDDKERRQIEALADKSQWSSDELAERIKGIRPDPQEDAPASTDSVRGGRIVNAKVLTPLTPLRGTLYTYRIVQRKVLAAGVAGRLVVDLGFSTYRDGEARQLSLFSAEDIVESRPRDDVYRFFNTDRTEVDLYTYQAYVEKVVDGDTLKVHVDLGFGTWTRQILRLRGIDASEVGTKSGDAAKAYVQSLVKEADRIVIRSSRSDKYDRYLADVFIPSGKSGEEVFLNNLLLEKGFAERWE